MSEPTTQPTGTMIGASQPVAQPVAQPEPQRERGPAEQAMDRARSAHAAAADAVRVGTFVRDEAGRYGLVVAKGRRPGIVYDQDADRHLPEGPEPVILWLAGDASPYGLPVTPISTV